MARVRPPCSIPGCDRPHVWHGYCSRHYQRFLRYGDPLAGRASPVPSAEQEAFLRSLIDGSWPEECITWPYSRTKKGYGVMTLAGVRIAAHRGCCKLAHGAPLTTEHEAAHSCGRGHLGCVNPGHLRWATPKENAADTFIHGTNPRGERNPAAVLTEAQVLEIAALKGVEKQSSIARRYNTTQPTVADIHRGGAWSWLTGIDPASVGRVRGSRQHASKLSEADARSVLGAHRESRRSLAARFGVSPQCIDAIRNGRTWSWLARDAA